MRPDINGRVLRLLKPMPGRTSAQVAGILGIGRPHASSTLYTMVKQGRLRRELDTEGEWTYYLKEEEG